MTPSAGEIWVADRGDEIRRLVLVISDERFHRLAERAVVAPVLERVPIPVRPWHILIANDRAVAVNHVGTISIERLLERAELTSAETLRRARHAMRAIAG